MTRHHFPVHAFLLLVLTIALTACSTAFEATATHENHRSTRIPTEFFTLNVIEKNMDHSDTLHVYLHGDGTPWKPHAGKFYPSKDPTPTHHTTLNLFTVDTQAALFIARPCYYLTHTEKQHQAKCHSNYWWTHGRYHQTIVDSIAAAIQTYQNRFNHIVIIGYSGGGTLAYLSARALSLTPSTSIKVVTVAGNMDVKRWVLHHQYSPLTGSVDPSDVPPLPTTIEQIHLAGMLDTNIYPNWLNTFSNQQLNSKFIQFDTYNHQCCWVNDWQTVLDTYINK